MSRVQEDLAVKFRRRGIAHCTINAGDKTLVVSLADDAEKIQNPCQVDSRCCYQNGHGGKCDITLHKHFDRILAHVSGILGN